MKLSFSLPPKTKSRSTVRPISGSNVAKEFVSEFDPSETLHSARPKYVIPPIEERRKALKDIEFEADIPSGEGHVSDKITYGLNLRQKVEKNPNPKPEPVEKLLLKSLRNDLKSLPDAPELEELKSFQVEGFGVALLAGYGWKPGKGIGRKAKDVVQIVERKNWTCNEGFGFNRDKARVKGTNAKMKVSGKLDKPKKFKGGDVSKEVRSISGRDTRVSKRSRETEPTEDRACKKNYRGQTIETREKAHSWLRSHIRVRIISKHVKGERFYLKKAVVTDVVGPTTCDITMDETQEVVQGINQELLETALPRRGGPVLVLSGGHKGVYGSLIEKDLDKETGVVCDADSKEMLDVRLEQVAEYIGDPADIGY